VTIFSWNITQKTLDHLLQGAKPSQPITLRVLKEGLETARRLAGQKGLGYQTYIKMLRDALKTEEIKQAARSGTKKTAKSGAREFARRGTGNGR
jgi:hypothetical protein